MIEILHQEYIFFQLLNKKQSDKSVRFDIKTEDVLNCIEKIKKFITRVYKMRVQESLPKFNEYFLLVLLKIYIDEKDKLNEKLESYENYKEYNIDKYYQKLFNKNTNGKVIKIIQGKYLEKTLQLIMENTE